MRTIRLISPFPIEKLLSAANIFAEKDQTRPQIQGLITLFGRLKIHSFTFHPNFFF